MSALTILTGKSINKDQCCFISPGPLLERIGWLNNTSKRDYMTSLNIFYSGTGEIFFRIVLAEWCLCFLVICCSSVVDAFNSPSLKKHTMQIFLHETSLWSAPRTSSNETNLYYHIFYAVLSPMRCLVISLNGNCTAGQQQCTPTSRHASELLSISQHLDLQLQNATKTRESGPCQLTSCKMTALVLFSCHPHTVFLLLSCSVSIRLVL